MKDSCHDEDDYQFTAEEVTLIKFEIGYDQIVLAVWFTLFMVAGANVYDPRKEEVRSAQFEHGDGNESRRWRTATHRT